MYRSKNKKRGFTLVEVIVVFVILGFLAMIFFSILNRAKEKSVNGSVVQSAVQFRKALELYAFNNGGKYPGENPNVNVPLALIGKQRQSDGSYNTVGPSYMYDPSGNLISDISTFENLIDEYMPIKILESPITGQRFSYFYGDYPNYRCGDSGQLRYMILLEKVGGFETENLPVWKIKSGASIIETNYFCVPGPEGQTR